MKWLVVCLDKTKRKDYALEANICLIRYCLENYVGDLWQNETISEDMDKFEESIVWIVFWKGHKRVRGGPMKVLKSY